jgi:Asp-tRNA(Asn)/Glu-tRNA(Gln) amidotransferase A subunit family amidase
MNPHAPTRRQLLAAAASLGVGTTTFHRALAAQAQKADAPGTITTEMIANAEWVAGVKLTEEQRKTVAGGMTQWLGNFAALHKLDVPNSVPPAIHFIPNPGDAPAAAGRGTVEAPKVDAMKPEAADDLAFLPLTHLAELVRAKKVSSTELTKLSLERLKKYDPALKCVVTLTEELALKQAAQADKEIAAGKYRGPLHGIPWVAKDLVAYPGFKTTWGAAHYKDQTIDEKATVAARLDEAGAVLVAKTTLGALANGDEWFGGRTNNPWDVKQGSSGSSAGTSSAVSAGLVPFGIGSETLGSIVSPCTRCRVTGLRPTFGRVSRAGCMALSWSMDKIGPIARTVEDCALVFGVIHGADGKDPTAVTRPFNWPRLHDLKDLRVGIVEGRAGAPSAEDRKVLESLGVKLVPITLPNTLPVQSLQFILIVEASAAFDDITRAGTLDGIGRSWPGDFRRGRFVPAVEYLRAQRVRTLLMQEMAKVMEQVDLYVHSGYGELLISNLTGHPTVVVPNGQPAAAKGGRGNQMVPFLFVGRLWGEAEALAVAKAYQDSTGHHTKRPPLEKALDNGEKK